MFGSSEYFGKVFWHAFQGSFFYLNSIGKQESQHVGLFAHQPASLQVWDQPVTKIQWFQTADVGAVDGNGFFLIETCRVCQYVVDVKVFDKLFGGENVFVW